MKTVRTILLIVLLISGIAGGLLYLMHRNTDEKIARFITDASNLIAGLQQYKEFAGSYPTGDNLQISKALLGQTEKKITILTVRKMDLSPKGEILDPWGTPVQIYFSQNSVLIRSAGPNKIWEDSSALKSDDLFRTN